MLQDLIKTYEVLKKYIYIINRGDKKTIIIRFKDENFYHLVGLHKINMDRFFPDYIKTKKRKYEYIKKHIHQFDGILQNQIKEKDTLIRRIQTFSKILDLLKGTDKTLLDLKIVPETSQYKGDYGILKIYEKVNCLLCLKVDYETEREIYCVPQSWMADTRIIQITEYKRPIYMENISMIPSKYYNK